MDSNSSKFYRKVNGCYRIVTTALSLTREWKSFVQQLIEDTREAGRESEGAHAGYEVHSATRYDLRRLRQRHPGPAVVMSSASTTAVGTVRSRSGLDQGLICSARIKLKVFIISFTQLTFYDIEMLLG